MGQTGNLASLILRDLPSEAKLVVKFASKRSHLLTLSDLPSLHLSFPRDLDLASCIWSHRPFPSPLYLVAVVSTTRIAHTCSAFIIHIRIVLELRIRYDLFSVHGHALMIRLPTPRTHI